MNWTKTSCHWITFILGLPWDLVTGWKGNKYLKSTVTLNSVLQTLETNNSLQTLLCINKATKNTLVLMGFFILQNSAFLYVHTYTVRGYDKVKKWNSSLWVYKKMLLLTQDLFINHVPFGGSKCSFWRAAWTTPGRSKTKTKNTFHPDILWCWTNFVYSPVLLITAKVGAADNCFDCVTHTHWSLAKHFYLTKFVDLVLRFCHIQPCVNIFFAHLNHFEPR